MLHRALGRQRTGKAALQVKAGTVVGALRLRGGFVRPMPGRALGNKALFIKAKLGQRVLTATLMRRGYQFNPCHLGNPVVRV
jgi:hypothetical protein